MATDPGIPTSPSIPCAMPAARERLRWFSLRTTLLALIITGLLQIDLLLPLHFKPIFMDFHLKLPALTQLWLDVGDWWNAAYAWAIAWPVAVAFSIGITLLRRRPRPGDERARWLLLVNLAFLALNSFFILTVIAVYQPMITLIEGISNSGGKK